MSQIGKPIDSPQVVSVKMIPLDFSKTDLPSHIVSEIEGVVNNELDNIRDVTRLILEGKVTLY